jgi:hypothetical protein
MNVRDRVTLTVAYQMLGTYDRLFKALAKKHGVEIATEGRIRYVAIRDVEKLRPHVEAWKNRPRLCRLASA